MTPTKDLNHSLALELFHRTSTTASVGLAGVGIMVYPHMATRPWELYLGWAAPMALIIFARILFGHYASQALKTDTRIERYINFEAVLCLLTGISWARSFYLFDSLTMDQAFYFRLMILATTIAFVLWSTSVFIRLFLAFSLPIAFAVIAFVVSRDYVQPRSIFLTCIVLYLAMLVASAVLTNRRIRSAAENLLAVTRLSAELNAALETQQHLLDVISKSAMTDELTKVFNRRGILDNLERELARSRRSGRPLAVLLIDVDQFKRINDAYGHGNGDLALYTVAQSMQQTLRDTDVLGRFGGEEFLAVLPDLEGDRAVVAANRLREHIQKSQLALAGRLVPVTISVGVAVRQGEDDAESLLARADKALDEAKSHGRNRVGLDTAEEECA
jgi:diguanylate cyclase (GGDEF)-like protein